ncbi:MAG: acyl-CoA dehydrogenase family protein [Candidatus Obscuribacterales bacterium]|jgi:acyl-CoA dehydrogenase|nr:acyl-CoA dehydrogenase family protein [Candidatus Obscuribacterales bacterium]
MTDLILSDDSKEYQSLASDFFENEVASKSESLDHEGKVPLDLYKKCWELGLATGLIPEEFGGLGLSLWDSCVIAEEAGKSSGGFSALLEGNALATAPLLVAGNKDQKSKYLSQLTEKPTLAAYIFPTGDDLPTYKKSGTNFELKGEKLVALNGENAIWYVVLAIDADNNEKTMFVFEAAQKGLTRNGQIAKLGRRCADICAISLDGVQVGEANVLGSVGDGDDIYNESSIISKTIIAAHATGTISGALQHSIKYSKERITFGKPISTHQAVSFMLADMAKAAQAARLLAWKSAWLHDNGSGDYLAAKCAQVYAVDAAMSSSTDAVQVFGGYGYSKEYPVERLMRDAKMMQMMCGTAHNLKFEIGKELLSSGCV